ncbi:hypothetical protein [Hyphomonas sp.]|uniref:hypothetical protein n=1 Tax=Hyphomonas sp. TaxID=87 RepID=UPI0025BF7A93|nr:hypothetical protein [Hyphomonas sp.]|tara:strand:- start:370 stop:951 length:582 start_codon:yes stop_codon:yes gene_type:complete
MWKPFIIGTILATIIVFFLNSMLNSALAETNTVSSTVVTNNTPPTANSPSVVVNNSDVCKTAVAGAVQTQILGISSGMTVTDENCEKLKLSRSLYAMGMKVSAISLLCSDSRVWDSMHMAGTPCPYMGAIGEEAKKGWEENPDMIPEGSIIFAKMQEVKEEEEKTNHTVRDLNDFEKFVIVGMAMYIGVPILF